MAEFEAFYGRNSASLLGLCFLLCLDREAAADATQESMLRAWQRWELFPSDGEALAWTRTVAMNLCRSRWRRIQREVRLAPRLYTVRSDPAPQGTDLLNALRRLPAKQRQAVVLFYWADLPVEACAQLMGVSAGTVKQHLTRARHHLGSDPALGFGDAIA